MSKQFDPRSLDDGPTFQPHRVSKRVAPAPPTATKWPPTRILAYVMWIGGVSIVLNLVSVGVICSLMGRINSGLTASDARVSAIDARFTEVEKWVGRERALRKQLAADPYWSKEAVEKRKQESQKDLADLNRQIQEYKQAGGVTGEVVRDLKQAK